MNRHAWVVGLLLAVATPRALAQQGPDTPAPEATPPPDAQTQAGAEGLDRNDATVEAMGDQEAKSHFRVGGTLYDEGRFREAAAEFEKAYALSGKPELLFNMYIAYRDAGLTKRAAEVLRKYLAEAPNVPDRRKLEVRLEAMEQTLEAEKEQGAEEVQAEDGTEPGAEAGETAREESGASPVPWVVIGVGAAAIVAASVTGIIALNDSNDIADACGSDNVCPPDFPLDAKRDEARRWTRATDALWPIGVAALGTGIALYFLMRPDEPATEAPVEASGGCTRDGCAGELRVRF